MTKTVSRMQNSAGFTLIELLVAIIVLASLSTIGLRIWQDIKLKSELSATTLSLFAFVQRAQAEANWLNKSSTLFLFKDRAQWCFGIVNGEQRPPSCAMAKFLFLPIFSSVEIVSFTENTALTFYGRRAMAQTGTIRLQNAQGVTKIIISTRGRIRYCSERTSLSGIPKC